MMQSCLAGQSTTYNSCIRVYHIFYGPLYSLDRASFSQLPSISTQHLTKHNLYSMSRSPPYCHKEEMADNFSDRTYPSDNTLYNIELNKLRSQIPDAQATRPKSMEYGYNPRYDSINNAPVSGSSKALRRVERVYATMCCGSCCGLFAWILGSLLIITAFVLLLVKALVCPLSS